MFLPKVINVSLMLLFVISSSGCRGLACQSDCKERLAFDQFIDEMIAIIESEEK